MDNQNNKNNPKNNRQGWGDILITTLLVTFMVIGFYTLMRGAGPEEISYDKFLDMVDDKKVESVRLNSSRIYITLTDKARMEEAEEKAKKQQESGGLQGMMGQFQSQFLSQFQGSTQTEEEEDDDAEWNPDYYTGYVDDDGLVDWQPLKIRRFLSEALPSLLPAHLVPAIWRNTARPASSVCRHVPLRFFVLLQT